MSYSLFNVLQLVYQAWIYLKAARAVLKRFCLVCSTSLSGKFYYFLYLSFLSFIGTVNKLNEQVTKNVFPSAKKKRRRSGLRRDSLMQQPKKQASKLSKFNYLQFLNASRHKRFLHAHKKPAIFHLNDWLQTHYYFLFQKRKITSCCLQYCQKVLLLAAVFSLKNFVILVFTIPFLPK